MEVLVMIKESVGVWRKKREPHLAKAFRADEEQYEMI